ncbi:MAG TPA: hypothetical protein V6D06_14160, partial [Trichocoleus sp.]
MALGTSQTKRKLAWPLGELRRLWCDRTALAALLVLTVIVLALLVGPLLHAASPNQIDFARSLLPPSVAHPFGTNDLGQDQLARILVGGRISLAVGVAAMAIAIVLGVLVGALAGFYG